MSLNTIGLPSWPSQSTFIKMKTIPVPCCLNWFIIGQAQLVLSADVTQKVPMSILGDGREQQPIDSCFRASMVLSIAEYKQIEILKTRKMSLIQKLLSSQEVA
jgi:hypothetical protein